MTVEYIIITVLSLYSIVVSVFCVRFGVIILGVQDAVEESLDIIDEQYSSINEILERPLFYDSPEVRRVLDSISHARDSIFDVARSLSVNFAPEVDEVDKDEIGAAENEG